MVHKRIRKIIIRAVLITSLIVAVVLGTIIPASKAGYDYTHLVKETVLEEGTELKGLKSSDVQGMKKAAENENLELLYNEKTTEIAVKDKRSGKIWYSNPADRDADPLANNTEKQKMSSILTVNYRDKMAREYSMLSYVESVEREQFEAVLIPNGLRVEYTMGDVNSALSKIPMYITQERLEEKILSQLEKKDAKFMKKRYGESPTKEGFLEIRKDTLKSEMYLEEIVKILDAVGYTAEDLAYENEQAGYESDVVQPFVKMAIEYTLDDDKMNVRIPLKTMEYEESMTISGISVLNYFGAGSSEEDGYLLVPSGSGALIDFNNGKQAEDIYMQPVYGVDPVEVPNTQLQSQQTVRLPIFGIKEGNNAFLATIESGQAVAAVSADVSGRTNSYNNVYSSYIISSTEELDMTGVVENATVKTLLEKKGYREDISISYCFMPEEKASYTGMANYYRDYLIGKGELTAREVKEQPSLYLDILGGAQKRQITYGVPHQIIVPMTTYEQAGEILDLLAEKNILDVQMKYRGWFNRGVNHDVAKDIDLDKEIGTKKELKELDERLTAQGGALYPEVRFQYVPHNTKDYSETYEASRAISGQTKWVAPYNPATLRKGSEIENEVSFVNSPNALPGQMTSFLKEYEKLSLNQIALADMGDVLSSDKSEKRNVDRDVSRLIAEEQLGRLSEQTENVMVSGGNQYALKYADRVIDIPTTADRFFIIDHEIPFYEMVIRGCLDYAGKPINTDNTYNEQEQILRMVEYGTAPHFALTYCKTADLNDTVLQDSFTTNYLDWMDTIEKFYSVATEVQAEVYNAVIEDHIIHENGLREIVYDNGVKIYVNYTDSDLKADGVTVKAKNYEVRR